MEFCFCFLSANDISETKHLVQRCVRRSNSWSLLLVHGPISLRATFTSIALAGILNICKNVLHIDGNQDISFKTEHLSPVREAFKATMIPHSSWSDIAHKSFSLEIPSLLFLPANLFKDKTNGSINKWTPKEEWKKKDKTYVVEKLSIFDPEINF